MKSTLNYLKEKIYGLKNSPRRQFPLATLISPLSGLLVAVIIIVTCAQRPAEALFSFFTGTFNNAWYFGSMLNTAAFLMTAGCGAAIAIKSGDMNLGGEGQVYVAGYVAARILLTGGSKPSPAATVIVFILALAGSMGAAALMAMLSALLKERRGARVLLTSFLFSAASLPLVDALITRSKSGTDQNLLALNPIAENFHFPQLLPPSSFSISFFIALALCIVLQYFLTSTREGRILRLWGVSPTFATYAGLSSARTSYFVMCVSGALHGLTAFFAVCGTYYTCYKGFYVNMGWNALSCALIVGSNPIALIPSALILSWLYTSAGRVDLTQGFGFDIAGIVQGVILFAIAIPFAVKTLRRAK